MRVINSIYSPGVLYYHFRFSLPCLKSEEKSLAVSASTHIYNAQTNGVQHESMVKPPLKVEGYTSWSIYSIPSFYCAQRDTFGIWHVTSLPIQVFLWKWTFLKDLSQRCQSPQRQAQNDTEDERTIVATQPKTGVSKGRIQMNLLSIIVFLAEKLCYLTGNIFGVEISWGKDADDIQTMCGWCADDMRASRFRARFHWWMTYVIHTLSVHHPAKFCMLSTHHPEACMSSAWDGSSSA